MNLGLIVQIPAADRQVDSALAEASRAVVLILSTSADCHLFRYSEAANGVLFSEDGYLLTVSHGLTGSLPEVYVGDKRYAASVVYNDRIYDFAILKITAGHPLPYFRFAGETAINQKVYLVGKRKRHRELFMSKGILNAKGINMSSSEIGREEQRITLAMEQVCFLPVIESVVNHLSVDGFLHRATMMSISKIRLSACRGS